MLQITTAPFEIAVGVVEAVKKATEGMSLELDAGDAALSDPLVRKALYGAFPFTLWGIYPVGDALFNDPKLGDKARSDYFEICSRVMEVNMKPFFLNISSESSDSKPQTSVSPGST